MIPNSSDRSLYASWVKLERWNALAQEEQDTFPRICPDVIEFRSHTNRLTQLQEKMQEYLRSGLRLGCLIDPKTKNVEIYRQGREVEVLEFPAQYQVKMYCRGL